MKTAPPLKRISPQIFKFVKKLKYVFLILVEGSQCSEYLPHYGIGTPKPPIPSILGCTRLRPLSHHWLSYRREPSGLFTRSLPPSVVLQTTVGENQRLSSFELRGEIRNLNCNWWGSLITKRVSLHKQLAHYPACLTEFCLLTIRIKGAE